MRIVAVRTFDAECRRYLTLRTARRKGDEKLVWRYLSKLVGRLLAHTVAKSQQITKVVYKSCSKVVGSVSCCAVRKSLTLTLRNGYVKSMLYTVGIGGRILRRATVLGVG
jgi:hypothetical protein